MTTNEIIFFLRHLILSDADNQKLADIALVIYQSSDNTLSHKLGAFLPEIIAMDSGRDFYLSKQYMLESLWKCIENTPVEMVCNTNCLYSPGEGIDYLIQQSKSSCVSLCEILKECRGKFNCNDLQTFWFIVNFIKKLNMPNNLYSDIPQKWFITPQETQDVIFEYNQKGGDI